MIEYLKKILIFKEPDDNTDEVREVIGANNDDSSTPKAVKPILSLEEEGKTEETVPTSEEEGKTEETVLTSEEEGKTEETVPTPEEEGKTEETVPTSEEEGKTEETVPTSEEEGKTKETVSTSEEEGKTEGTVPFSEAERKTEDETETIMVHCTQKAAIQIQKAVATGRIPFANTDEGQIFLGFLLGSFRGRIDNFYMSVHGKPVINNFFPGAGGLSSISWRLWQIAVKFPDQVDSLMKVAGVLVHPDVTYESLNPELKSIIDSFENLQPCKGEVVYIVPKGRAKLVGFKDHHNPEAVEKLIKAQYGEGAVIQDVQLDESTQNKGRVDKIILYSNSKVAFCPHCGQPTIKRASGGPSSDPRRFWDTPIRFGISTLVEIYGVKKYVCENQECPQNQFTETFSCVLPYKQFSIRLTGMVIAMAALTSYHGGQDLWTLCGVRISDQTIRRLVLDLTFPDNPNTTMAGIDDVAKRRGCSYYTIIYSLEDHRLLAIVDGRDGSELIKWLDKHKEIRLICRDRAAAYSNAIDQWAENAGVEVTEVADRFHLIQNMINQLKEHCASSLPLHFGIIEKGETVKIVEKDNEMPHKKAFAKGMGLTPEQIDIYDTNYDNSPYDKNHNPITFEVPSLGGTKKENKVSEDTPLPPDSETDKEKVEEQPIDEKEQEKRIAQYIRFCSIRNEFDPSKPKKPQYLELSRKYGIKGREIGKICRMKAREVEAILRGVAEDKKNEVTASYQPALKESAEKKCATSGGTYASAEAAKQEREKNYNTACSVRNEFDLSKPRKPQYKDLAEKYGITPKEAGIYCRMTDQEVECIKDTVITVTTVSKEKKREKTTKTKARKIDDYKYIVYKMLQDGHNINDVFWYVKHKGCKLTDEGLIKNVVTIYEIVFPNRRKPDIKKYIDLKYDKGEYVIRRCDLMKYLVTVNPKAKKNKIIEKHEKLILSKYASVRNVQTIFREFHSAIMGDAEEAIDAFISRYKDGELRGFCKSLSQDIEAIKNAIRYSYSSGFVEGGNSKFKLLKRVSCGRLQLDSLYQKCMLGFWYTLDDFQLKDVAPFLDIG